MTCHILISVNARSRTRLTTRYFVNLNPFRFTRRAFSTPSKRRLIQGHSEYSNQRLISQCIGPIASWHERVGLEVES